MTNIIYVTPESLGSQATQADVEAYITLLAEEIPEGIEIQIVNAPGITPAFGEHHDAIQAAQDRAWQRFLCGE